ncbi:MAG: VRR-NUC domain-containing protein [Syntrophobacteraceae bacterium]
MAGGGCRFTQEEYDAFLVKRGQQPGYQNRTPKKGEASETLGQIEDHEPEHEGLECELQVKCQDHCDKHGWMWLHDRSRGKNESGKFLDLIVALPAGRTIWCELKRKGEKLSDTQKRTKARLLYLGHEVYEIRNFRQFVRACEPKKGAN